MPLNPRELATLRAVIDRLIPADEYPSGWDAGVGDFLARHLAGDGRDQLPLYQQGLAALDAEAQAAHARAFAAATAEQQDALLQRIEAGMVSTRWPVPPVEFMSVLINHAAEGFYSDPGNGGNRDAVSWRMIGFDPVRPPEQLQQPLPGARGRAEQQQQQQQQQQRTSRR